MCGGADRVVRDVLPVARIVSSAGARAGVVRHLVVLEARRAERRVREEKIALVARVGCFGELAAIAPVAERRMGLDGEAVEREMVRMQGKRARQVFVPVARYIVWESED